VVDLARYIFAEQALIIEPLSLDEAH